VEAGESVRKRFVKALQGASEILAVGNVLWVVCTVIKKTSKTGEKYQ